MVPGGPYHISAPGPGFSFNGPAFTGLLENVLLEIVLTLEHWLFLCAIKRRNNELKLMINGPVQRDITWEKAGKKYPRESSIHLAIIGTLKNT